MKIEKQDQEEPLAQVVQAEAPAATTDEAPTEENHEAHSPNGAGPHMFIDLGFPTSHSVGRHRGNL